MPNAMVQTPEQEQCWTDAKSKVREQYPDCEEDSDRFWALTTTIYKQMCGLDKCDTPEMMGKSLLHYLRSAPNAPTRQTRARALLKALQSRRPNAIECVVSLGRKE